MPAKKPAPKARAKARPKGRPAPKAKPRPVARPPAAAPPKPSKLVLEQPVAAPPPPPPPPEPPVATVTPEELVAALAPAEPGRLQRRFIVLDSNALMMQFQFSVDIESEMRRLLDIDYEILVPDIVIGELRNLASSLPLGKERGEAVMAIKLATTFRVVKTEGPADTGILRLAEKLNAIVVTNDKILRARLRAKNIANIHLRSKAFLTVEGHVGF